MITDIEEESKTKFSMGVEFTFLLKADNIINRNFLNLQILCVTISYVWKAGIGKVLHANILRGVKLHY